jgi:hypothetical protein
MVFVETKEIRQPDGTTRSLDLYARAGSIGIGTLAADGELLFTALPRTRTHRNVDKGGYRWYNDYRLPESLGGGLVTVRLHGNAKDEDRKFNRTENVRPIAPDDPSFRGLFRRRNDAESMNRALEDTMWLRRAHSLGHRRQLLNLLGYALMGTRWPDRATFGSLAWPRDLDRLAPARWERALRRHGAGNPGVRGPTTIRNGGGPRGEEVFYRLLYNPRPRGAGRNP